MIWFARRKNTPKVFVVANYFIDRFNKDGKHLDATKLQKLVYYSEAWSLAFDDKSMFDNDIEAWANGPVIPELYIKYKFSSNSLNKEKLTKKDLEEISFLGKKELDILEEVFNAYGDEDNSMLIWHTKEDLPWKEARKGLDEYENGNNIISRKHLRNFYKKRLRLNI